MVFSFDLSLSLSLSPLVFSSLSVSSDYNAALEVFGHGSICVDVGLTSTTSPSVTAYPFCYGYQYFSNGSSVLQQDMTGVQIKAYSESRTFKYSDLYLR